MLEKSFGLLFYLKKPKDYHTGANTASQLDPGNAVIWDNLGRAYCMTGDKQDAKNAFGRTLQINPSLQDAKNGFNAAEFN